jgi:hypothetical protein
VYLGNLFGGRAGTFGVILNENNAPLSSALGSAYFNRNENEAWNILWGYKFSNFALGLEFNRSFSSVEDTEFVLKPYTGPSAAFGPLNNARQAFNVFMALLGADHWNTLGVGGGISVDWESDARPNFADFSVEMRQHSFEDTDKLAATTVEDDAGMSYAVNGRAHLSMSDDFHWMPVVNYYHLDLSMQTGGTSFENTVNGLNAGVAAQWRLRESDWFVLGGAFQTVTADFEDLNDRSGSFTGGPGKIEYMTVPNIFASLESNLWSWFTLRLGASKPAFSRLKLTGSASESVGQAGEFELKDSPFQYSVGAGFHLGRVDLDAVMNQDFPFTGSWIASGNSEIPFTRLSATYRW